MLEKMSSQRIYASAVILVVVIMVSAGVIMQAIGVGRQLEELKTTRTPALLGANAIDVKLMKARSDVRRVLLFLADGKPDKAKTYQGKVEDDWRDINTSFEPLHALSARFVLQEDTDRVDKLSTELPLLHGEQTAIVEKALATGSKHVSAIDDELVKTVEPHGVAIREVAEAFSKSQVDQIDGEVAKSLRSQNQGEWILGISAFLAIASCLGVSFIFGHRVLAPLEVVAERLRVVSQGDLSNVKLPEALLARKDELGELASAAQAMSDNLRRLLGGISSGAQTLASAATELSAISRQTASGTASMADRANAVAAAAEEASSNTLSIAAGMEQSSGSLSSVASATEQMSATVGDISANTGRARAISEQATGQAQTITEQMQKLGQAAQEIGHVTETITNISAQTNLLALNATIEAARAGAAGKGFAVVANEIKELAKQTAEATEDIKARIAGIQSSTGSAISDIGQITAVIKDVSGIVASIAAAIEEQATVTRDVAGNIAQASIGVQEANDRVSQTAEVSRSIARDIAGVNAAVTGIRHGGEQVQSSALDLSKLAELLGAQVAQFRV
jgi:methyl-accepting chemotaxis protein